MTDKPYELSDTLFGHTEDVRCLAVSGNGQILSGSRDYSAKLWQPELNPRSKFYLTASFSCHTKFVSSVCFLPPNSIYPDGIIITGSNDSKIRLFTPSSPTPFKILENHTGTVCKLVPGTFGWTLLSSSWDQTARGWREEGNEWKCATFSGHTSAVWSVCQLATGLVITASADKTLRVYGESGDIQRQLLGHTDCVRDVVAAGTEEVLSAANDASVRHWNVISGDCLNTYYGHGHYIYSIAMLPGIGWVTSSEDRTVKVWSLNGEVQSINLPCMSVWAVAVLPNSDIVTGSNDGAIRIFTKDPDRVADAETLATFSDQLEKFASSDSTGGVKLSELAGPEALTIPGKSDGQTKMIREGNKAMAYCWSASQETWEKIGEVVGSGDGAKGGESGRPTHNGVDYDFVFNVDIEDGKPALKLPYNKTDDPWLSAQKFIHDNDLPQVYLEQVANFIITNSGQSGPSQVQPEFVDPFTGGSRYVPSASTSSNSSSASNVTKSQSSYTSAFFPHREFLRFDQANVDAIKDKILLLNKDNNLGADETAIDNLLEKCKRSAPCSKEDLTLLKQLLQWPTDLVFPILDVTRLLIRQNDVASELCTDSLLNDLQPFLQVHPNNMLVLRICCNMMVTQAGEELASKHRLKLIEFLLSVPSPYSKFIQIALATLLLNVAVMLRRSETPDGKEEALLAARELIGSFQDQEAIFRALVALGTFLVDSPKRRTLVEPFSSLLNKFTSDPTSRLRECANELINSTQ